MKSQLIIAVIDNMSYQEYYVETMVEKFQLKEQIDRSTKTLEGLERRREVYLRGTLGFIERNDPDIYKDGVELYDRTVSDMLYYKLTFADSPDESVGPLDFLQLIHHRDNAPTEDIYPNVDFYESIYQKYVAPFENDTILYFKEDKTSEDQTIVDRAEVLDRVFSIKAELDLILNGPPPGSAFNKS